MTRRAGFSLVELIIVVLIVSILFAGVTSVARIMSHDVSKSESGGESMTALEVLHGVKVFEILFGREPRDAAEMVSSGVLVFAGDIDDVSIVRNNGVPDVVFRR